MQRPGGFGGGFGGRFSPQQMPQQSRFGGGLGGLFGGMGGYNPYQQQMPRRGGMMGRRFNPMMGRRFNPMMGGGFNPMMGGGFNPYMGGGGFNPYMGGGFQGYDFNSPIGEAPPGVEPTPPPSISDLFSGLDDDQRNSFLQQFGLAPTPPPIERAPVDERDMFDSGSIPGGPGFSIEQDPGDMMVGTMGGPVYDDAGNLIGNLGSAGPTFPPGVLGPIVGGEGGQVPQPEPEPFPGIDLDRIRESLAKMEPIIPGISLPEPTPTPVTTPEVSPTLNARGEPLSARQMEERIRTSNQLARAKGRPEPFPLFPEVYIEANQNYKSTPAPMPVKVPMPAPMPVKGPRIAPPPGKMLPEPMPMPGQPKLDPGLLPITTMPIKPVPVKGPPPKRISDPIKVPPPVKVPMPVKGPRLPIKTSPPKIRPMPMPSLPIGFDPDSLFSDPGLGGEVGGPVRGPIKPIRVQPQPMPMPAPMPKIRPMPAPIVAPLPRVISDPVRPKPAPITRGIGGVRRMPVGRER